MHAGLTLSYARPERRLSESNDTARKTNKPMWSALPTRKVRGRRAGLGRRDVLVLALA